MDSTDYGLIALVVILALFIIGIANYISNAKKVRLKQLKESVAKTSPLISKMIELEHELGINYGVKPKYTRTFTVKSKQTLDHFDFQKYITNDVMEDYDNYKELYDTLENNMCAWIEFTERIKEKEFQHIPVGEDLLKSLKISEEKYIELENEFIEKLKKNEPPDSCEIDFIATYRTPKGTTTYTNKYEASSESIGVYLREADKIKEYRESAKYQRSLITTTTRLRIIAKDHGRCCLCGRSATEGAQLEVDHFIPVSKGGKSSDDNLWTLCRDCNRGKSNYDIEELQEVFDQAMSERK